MNFVQGSKRELRRLSPEFQHWVADDPPRGASRLKEVLGNDFDGALRAALSTDSYGLTHGLLASLRVGEVLTTNIDQLYELAAAGRHGC